MRGMIGVLDLETKMRLGGSDGDKRKRLRWQVPESLLLLLLLVRISPRGDHGISLVLELYPVPIWRKVAVLK
jgi:hypothetical protein